MTNLLEDEGAETGDTVRLVFEGKINLGKSDSSSLLDGGKVAFTNTASALKSVTVIKKAKPLIKVDDRVFLKDLMTLPDGTVVTWWSDTGTTYVKLGGKLVRVEDGTALSYPNDLRKDWQIKYIPEANNA